MHAEKATRIQNVRNGDIKIILIPLFFIHFLIICIFCICTTFYIIQISESQWSFKVNESITADPRE